MQFWLCWKPASCGIEQRVIKWFHCYLSNRQQNDLVNGELSGVRAVVSYREALLVPCFFWFMLTTYRIAWVKHHHECKPTIQVSAFPPVAYQNLNQHETSNWVTSGMA